MLKTPRLMGNVGKKHMVEQPTTLRTFLEDVAPGVTIAVCTREGSSFLFIGKIEDFRKSVMYIDFHYQYAATKYAYRHGRYPEYNALMYRNVLSYWARNLDGEDALWCIELSGRVVGMVWMQSECAHVMERLKKEFVHMYVADMNARGYHGKGEALREYDDDQEEDTPEGT